MKALPRVTQGGLLVAVVIVLMFGVTASAQSIAKPSFDVVSIRPDKSGNGMRSVNTGKGELRATNMTLKALVQMAYDLHTDDRISGMPSWASSASFDIQAKMDLDTVSQMEKLNPQQRYKEELGMLQDVLANRFQLKAHHEMKVLPSYELVVAKSGLKMKLADLQKTDPKNPLHRGMMWSSRGKMDARDVPVGGLATSLSMQLHRQVVDKTGLTGKYDYTLQFTPDDAPIDSKETTGADSWPSLYTALQEQLGLKLVSVKLPEDTIVIDSVEEPSAN